MESSQLLYTRQSCTKPMVRAETLTWWCWTCQLAGNPWTSPLASWPHWHLPSPQTPPCVDEPGGEKKGNSGGWGFEMKSRIKTENLTLTVPFSKLTCAGTVRPRQVQCPLWWPAIAQVSASQHQPISRSGAARRWWCLWDGWEFWTWSALHGFAQLLLTDTGWLPTLQSWPGPEKNPICSWTYTQHLLHLKERNFNWHASAEGMELPSSACWLTDGCSLPSCGCPCVQITPSSALSAGFAVDRWKLPAQTALLIAKGKKKIE